MNSASEQTTALIREEETISYILGGRGRGTRSTTFSLGTGKIPAMIHQDLLSAWVCFHPVRRSGWGAFFSRYDTTLTNTYQILSFQEICTLHPEPHIIQNNVAAFRHLPTQRNGILRHALRYTNHISWLQTGETETELADNIGRIKPCVRPGLH